jgi:hypothetical protein
MMTQAQEIQHKTDTKLDLTVEVQTLIINAYNDAKKIWENEVKALSDQVLIKMSEVKYLNEKIQNNQSKFFDRFFKKSNNDKQLLTKSSNELETLRIELLKVSNAPPDADKYELAVWGSALFQGYGTLK